MNNQNKPGFSDLNYNQLKKIGGGAVFSELIAFYYGMALGLNKRLAATVDHDDVDWDKARVLLGA